MLKVGLEMRLTKEELKEMRELFDKFSVAWKRDDGRDTCVLTFAGFLRFLQEVLANDFAGILEKCSETLDLDRKAKKAAALGAAGGGLAGSGGGIVTGLLGETYTLGGGDSDSDGDSFSERQNKLFARTKTDGQLLHLRRVSVMARDHDGENSDGSEDFLTSSLQLSGASKRQSTCQYSTPAAFLKRKMQSQGEDPEDAAGLILSDGGVATCSSAATAPSASYGANIAAVLAAQQPRSILRGAAGAGAAGAEHHLRQQQLEATAGSATSCKPSPAPAPRRVSMFLQEDPDMARARKNFLADLEGFAEEEEEPEITSEEFLEWYRDESAKITKKRQAYQKRLLLMRESLGMRDK
eukprot:g11044.t1